MMFMDLVRVPESRQPRPLSVVDPFAPSSSSSSRHADPRRGIRRDRIDRWVGTAHPPQELQHAGRVGPQHAGHGGEGASPQARPRRTVGGALREEVPPTFHSPLLFPLDTDSDSPPPHPPIPTDRG